MPTGDKPAAFSTPTSVRDSGLPMLRSVPFPPASSNTPSSRPNYAAPRARSRADANTDTLSSAFASALATGVRLDNSPLQDLLGPLAPENYAALPPCSRVSAKALIAAALDAGPTRVQELENKRILKGKVPPDGAADPFFADIKSILLGEEPSWPDFDEDVSAMRSCNPFKLTQPFPHLAEFTASVNSVHGSDLSATCDAYGGPTKNMPTSNKSRPPPSPSNKPTAAPGVVVLDCLSDGEPPMTPDRHGASSAKSKDAAEQASKPAEATPTPGGTVSPNGARANDAETPAAGLAQGATKNIVAGSNVHLETPGKKRARVKLDVFLVFDDNGKVSLDWNEVPVEPDSDVQAPGSPVSRALPPSEEFIIRDDAPPSFLEAVEQEMRADENNRFSKRNRTPKGAHRTTPVKLGQRTPPGLPKAKPKTEGTKGDNADAGANRQKAATPSPGPEVICIDADDEADTLPPPTKRKKASRATKSKASSVTLERKEERLASLEKAIAGMSTQDSPPPMAERTESAATSARKDAAVPEVSKSKRSAAPIGPRRISKRIRRPSVKALVESSDSDDEFRREPDEDFNIPNVARPAKDDEEEVAKVSAPSPTDSRDPRLPRSSSRSKRVTPRATASDGAQTTRLRSQEGSRHDPSPPSRSPDEDAPPVQPSNGQLTRQGRTLRSNASAGASSSAHHAAGPSRGEKAPSSAAHCSNMALNEEEAMDGEGPAGGSYPIVPPRRETQNMPRDLWRIELNEVEQDLIDADPDSPEISSSDGEIERGAAATISILQRVLRPILEDGRCISTMHNYDENEELHKYYRDTRNEEECGMNGTQFLTHVAGKHRRMLNGTAASEESEGHSQPIGTGGATITRTVTQQGASAMGMATAHASQPTLGFTSGLQSVGAGPSASGVMGTGMGMGGHTGSVRGAGNGGEDEDEEVMDKDSAGGVARAMRRSGRGGSSGMSLRERMSVGARRRTGSASGTVRDEFAEMMSSGDESSSQSGSSEESSERASVMRGKSKRARQHAKMMSSRARRLQERVCGEVGERMQDEVRRKVLRWAVSDFGWFDAGAEMMEMVAVTDLKECGRCSTSRRTEKCEESIIVKLWRDMSWRKVRRMRHIPHNP